MRPRGHGWASGPTPGRRAEAKESALEPEAEVRTGAWGVVSAGWKARAPTPRGGRDRSADFPVRTQETEGRASARPPRPGPAEAGLFIPLSDIHFSHDLIVFVLFRLLLQE